MYKCITALAKVVVLDIFRHFAEIRTRVSLRYLPWSILALRDVPLKKKNK